MKFEGWFKNSSDYDDQVEKSLIACPKCDSTEISKALMAPNISTSEMKNSIKEELIRMKAYVKTNFEDVGERFTDEAIAMYHGDADPRNIYGKITKEDKERLEEEGIPATVIPWVEDDS
jgi:hypothetical protein